MNNIDYFCALNNDNYEGLELMAGSIDPKELVLTSSPLHVQSVVEDLRELTLTLLHRLRTQQHPVAYTVAGEVTDWSKDFSAYKTQTYCRPVYLAPKGSVECPRCKTNNTSMQCRHCLHSWPVGDSNDQ